MSAAHWFSLILNYAMKLMHGLRVSAMRYAARASYNANTRHRECAETTRVEILNSVYRWLRPKDPSISANAPVLDNPIPLSALMAWLNGLAGSGKSTLARTIAEWCASKERGGRVLAASFFCDRFDDDCSNVKLIFPTIARQLASALPPSFGKALQQALKDNPGDICGYLPSYQFEKLIVEPLRSVPEPPPEEAYVVVIDALDECKDDSAISVILAALSLHADALRHLRFVITSRPETHISAGFRDEELRKHAHSLRLASVPEEWTRRDIITFLRTRFKEIRQCYEGLREDWPDDGVLDTIAHQACGIFIYASTLLDYISDRKYVVDPKSALESLLNPSTGSDSEDSEPSEARSPMTPLYALYTDVMKSAYPDGTKLDKPTRKRLRLVLGSIVVLRDQLSPAELGSLLQLDEDTVRSTLQRLHSVINVPEVSRKDEVIRVIHPSFHDFLLDPSRRSDTRSARLAVDPQRQHIEVAKLCLQALGALDRDMCHIEARQLPNNEITDLEDLKTAHLPLHLQYACKHWAHHLSNGTKTVDDDDVANLLEDFCRNRILMWLECLSLMGSMDGVVEALQDAMRALKVRRILQNR